METFDEKYRERLFEKGRNNYRSLNKLLNPPNNKERSFTREKERNFILQVLVSFGDKYYGGANTLTYSGNPKDPEDNFTRYSSLTSTKILEEIPRHYDFEITGEFMDEKELGKALSTLSYICEESMDTRNGDPIIYETGINPEEIENVRRLVDEINEEDFGEAPSSKDKVAKMN